MIWQTTTGYDGLRRDKAHSGTSLGAFLNTHRKSEKPSSAHETILRTENSLLKANYEDIELLVHNSKKYRWNEGYPFSLPGESIELNIKSAYNYIYGQLEDGESYGYPVPIKWRDSGVGDLFHKVGMSRHEERMIKWRSLVMALRITHEVFEYTLASFLWPDEARNKACNYISAAIGVTREAANAMYKILLEEALILDSNGSCPPNFNPGITSISYDLYGYFVDYFVAWLEMQEVSGERGHLKLHIWSEAVSTVTELSQFDIHRELSTRGYTYKGSINKDYTLTEEGIKLLTLYNGDVFGFGRTTPGAVLRAGYPTIENWVRNNRPDQWEETKKTDKPSEDITLEKLVAMSAMFNRPAVPATNVIDVAMAAIEEPTPTEALIEDLDEDGLDEDNNH